MAKKKKKKVKKRAIFSIMFGFLGIGCIVLGICSNNLFMKEEKKVFYDDIPYPKVEESKLSLIMVGDSLIHGAVYQDAKTSSGYDFKPMFSEIKGIFESSELRFYNQESILGGSELGLSSYPQFNSPYEAGDAYMDMKFNLVSLANNHTLDRGYYSGYKTILNSRAYWDKQDGVIATGSFATQEQRDEVVVKEINGIKYGLLAYTMETNGLVAPSNKKFYMNVYDKDIVKKDIEKLRDKVDLLMVSMHWGVEYSTSVSSVQKEVAKYLSDLGVDVIIGTHPHVVQPIEFIGNTMVVYSLGNFISSQIGVEKLTGLVARITVNKTVVDGKVYMKLSNPQADLVYTCKSVVCGHFKIYRYDKLTSNILPNSKLYYDKYMKIVRSLDSNIGTIFTKEG